MAYDFPDLHRQLQQVQKLLQDAEDPRSRQALLALIRVLESSLLEVESRLEGLAKRHEDLDERLLKIENSRFLRLVQWPGRLLLDWKGRLGQMLLLSPWHPLYLKLARPRAAAQHYQRWVEQEEAATPPHDWFAQQVQAFARRPRISVVIPVHQPRREWLEAAVDSVLRQSYPCWELCICADSLGEPWLDEYLSRKAAADQRVRFARGDRPLGISECSNRAGALARGDYVGFLDQDDVLAPHALYHVAEAVQDQDADVIYSDEDRLEESGRRAQPIFKPAWSPDLLLGGMYVGHFLVARREKLERIGWFRPAFDGSQDYDLVLRLTDTPGVARHIPRILYHWRMHAQSTAANLQAKPYSHQAGRQALADMVARRGWDARVEDGAAPNTYRVRRRVCEALRASLIICSRQPRLLERCLRAIDKRTAHACRELVVVQHQTGEDAAMNRLLERTACVRVLYTGAFNYSVMNNLGASRAGGEVLVFLNDDVEPLGEFWLDELLAHAQRPEVGAVGARLLYPSGAIQHAGLAIGIMNGAGHLHRDTFGAAYWNWAGFTRNTSAVTSACMAMRQSVFEELGGFDPLFPVNYNDVDLCLRARRAGYQVIYEPAACLRHYESQTRERGIRYQERELWRERWGTQLDRGDPFYSPHLSVTREDASLRLDQVQWQGAGFR